MHQFDFQTKTRIETYHDAGQVLARPEVDRRAARGMTALAELESSELVEVVQLMVLC